MRLFDSLLTAVILVLGGTLFHPSEGEAQCNVCEEEVVAGGHLVHSIVSSYTALYGTLDPQHEWVESSCAFALHSNDQPCNMWLSAASEVSSMDAVRLAGFVSEDPSRFVINRRRQALQVLGCDGIEVVAHFPLDRRKLAYLGLHSLGAVWAD